MHHIWRSPVFALLFILTGSSVLPAQNQLDYRPLDPAIDPDIDLFIGDWRESIPSNTHGTLTERAILSPLSSVDHLKPSRKGEVLRYVRGFSFATLDAGLATVPTTPDSIQEIFYITGGEGVIKTSGTNANLRDGVFVLVPAGCEFSIENTGDVRMTMYLIKEPLVKGFTPKKDIVVKDEKRTPFRDQGAIKGHWSHNGRNMFTPADGLSLLESVALITMEPMTVAHPHSHGGPIEEAWTTVDGTLLEMIGKEIRFIGPGSGFLVPPTGFTPHAHINQSQEPVRLLLFARWKEL